jgi:RNA 3'-terminal phosphate cyclase (ATP)
MEGGRRMLEIDGSFGEGGGQVLRSAVALAMVTGTPVAVRNVRARRRRPGLMRQHLTAVRC